LNLLSYWQLLFWICYHIGSCYFGFAIILAVVILDLLSLWNDSTYCESEMGAKSDADLSFCVVYFNEHFKRVSITSLLLVLMLSHVRI